MHEHTHDVDPHDHAHRTGIRGLLSSIIQPHSHDPGDSVDSALASSTEGIRALKLTFVILLLTGLAQLGVLLVSGSTALLADTIHNFSDALTAVPLWIAFVLARRPPTDRFTYGLGRAEDVAGLFIVAAIGASAVIAGYESIRHLIDPTDISHVWVVFLAGCIGFVGNELVAIHRMRVGGRIGSAALVADGVHARADGLTSLAVAAGAVGVWAGFPLADPVVGLLITIAILASLKQAAFSVVQRLIDGVDPQLVQTARKILRDTDGVTGISALHLRWLGRELRAEAGIEVSPDLGLGAAHDIAHVAADRLVRQLAHLGGATVHVSPTASSRPVRS
jgi:cation diffusion facilitator family transporter